MASKKTSGKKPSFQDALARLEEITEHIEDNTTSLEDSVVLYKEAIDLTVMLSENLNEIEKEVMVLQKTASDTFVKKPFIS